jgi:hypothetical protein
MRLDAAEPLENTCLWITKKFVSFDDFPHSLGCITPPSRFKFNSGEYKIMRPAFRRTQRGRRLGRLGMRRNFSGAGLSANGALSV